MWRGAACNESRLARALTTSIGLPASGHWWPSGRAAMGSATSFIEDHPCRVPTWGSRVMTTRR